MSTFYGLPEVGAEVRLHTHLVVREDAHVLFGFATERERSLFRELIKVRASGRASRSASAPVTVDDFHRCVETEDAASLVRMPGIGRKTAERLIVEMRDRLTRTGGGWASARGAAGRAAPARRPRRSTRWSRSATSRRSTRKLEGGAVRDLHRGDVRAALRAAAG